MGEALLEEPLNPGGGGGSSSDGGKKKKSITSGSDKEKSKSRRKSRSKSPGKLRSRSTQFLDDRNALRAAATTAAENEGSSGGKRSTTRSKSSSRLNTSSTTTSAASHPLSPGALIDMDGTSPKTPKSAGYNSKKKKLSSKKLLQASQQGENNGSWWSLALEEDEVLNRQELMLEEAERQRVKLLKAKHDLEKRQSISKGLVAQRLQEAKTSALATATVRETKPTLFTNHRAAPLPPAFQAQDPAQLQKTLAAKFEEPKYQKDTAQKTLVKETAKKHFLLKDLAKGAKIDMKKLVKAFEPFEVEKGQPIVKAGEEGQHMYIVQEGTVEFHSSEGGPVQQAHAGDTFGERNLLFQSPEAATVVAAEAKNGTMSSDDDDDKNLRTVNSMDISMHSVATSHTKLLRLHQEDFRGLVLTTERAEKDRQNAIMEEKLAQVQRDREVKRASTLEKAGVGGKYKPKPLATKKPWYEDAEVQKRSQQLVAAIDKYCPTTADLDKLKVLGEGQFGEVWLVAPASNPTLGGLTPTPPQVQHEFALKIQALLDDDPGAEEIIRNELEIMKKLTHYPFVSTLYKTYEEGPKEDADNDGDEEGASRGTVDMLLGLIPGGELWDVVHQECEETGEWLSGIPEPHAQFYTLLVADTLGYLHSRNILFRDLKMENIMIDADGYPIVVDFGFAKQLKPHEKTYTFCGTPNYVAPEIIKNMGQTKAVDYWALGIVIYEMVSGENPFFYDGLSEMELFEAICEEKPEPLSSKKFSKNVRELVKELLHKDPTKRLGMESIEDITDHSWFHRYSLNKMRLKKVKAPWVPGKEDKTGAQHLQTNGGLQGVTEESDDDESIMDEEEIARLEEARKLIQAEEETFRKEKENRLKLEEEIAALERQEEVRRQEAARRKAEEAEQARLEAEQKAAAEAAARLKAEQEAAEQAARIKAEQEAAEQAARIRAEQEAAEEAARIKAEQEAAEQAARIKAEEEELARIKAEKKAAKIKAKQEAARLKAEQEAADEAARIKAEQEAEEEAARIKAKQEAVEEEARVEAERLAAVSEEGQGGDFVEEMGEMSLEDVFGDQYDTEANRKKLRDKSFDQSWSDVTTQRSAKPRKSSIEASPVPKGIVRRIVSGQGKDRSPTNLMSPRKVQEELNKSVTKGLVKDRLKKVKGRESSVPSLFSPFDF